MKPSEVDELDDEMWAGMVRHMETEARAIKAANAKIPKR
jgi:hypothetical protein